jgi:hypothetical protein
MSQCPPSSSSSKAIPAAERRDPRWRSTGRWSRVPQRDEKGAALLAEGVLGGKAEHEALPVALSTGTPTFSRSRALVDAMTTKTKTWLITGAGRGMGVNICQGRARRQPQRRSTGRNPDTVAEAVGDADRLLVTKLDVTSREDAEAAVKAAVDRFGGIDVLVNNSASFYAGFFEELTPEQMDRQLATSLIGPMHVTRAVLPVMRKQRCGHVVTISSSAGFRRL